MFSELPEIVSYTNPVFRSGKINYIEFSAFDPVSGKLKRKKIRVDNLLKNTATKSGQKEIISGLLARFTNALQSGWSPWVTQEKSLSFTSISEALSIYEKFVNRTQKEKSKKCHRSYQRAFLEFLSKKKRVKIIREITVSLVCDFLDYVFIDRELSARTRNNYRVWIHGFCSFLVSRNYLPANPVDSVPLLKQAEKFRQPLTPLMLSDLSEYLREKDPYFYLACLMEYYTFIRPNELRYIKIGDISVSEQSIFVSHKFSKNKRDGKVAMNEHLLKTMLDLDVLNKPSDYYLFGKDCKPSPIQSEGQIFRRLWYEVRRELGWAMEYQFYSLKDSGIRDLANEAGIIVARDQARHSDISTTNKYLQGRDLPVHHAAKIFKGKL